MKPSVVLMLGMFFAASAGASDFRNVTCWKGYNQKEQNANLRACRQQAANDQKCSTSLWETGQAAYDVCLMAPNGPLTIVSIFKGFNQREQDAALKACLQQQDENTICITSLWVHKQAAYDVCLMKVASPGNVAIVPSRNPPLVSPPVRITPPVGSPRAPNGVSYISSAGHCYGVDRIGQPFGSAVDDYYCSKGYKAGLGSSGRMACFNYDANGTVYGTSVDDYYCSKGYKAGRTSKNTMKCFNYDQTGRVYGTSVDDYYCHHDYLSDGRNCFNVDAYGVMYGTSVDDYYCRR